MIKKNLKFEVDIYGLTEPKIDITTLLSKFTRFMENESLDYSSLMIPKPRFLLDSPTLRIRTEDDKECQ